MATQADSAAILIWKEVSGHNSHSVSRREGHVAACIGTSMYVHGGLEDQGAGSKRWVNSLLKYDVLQGEWSLVKESSINSIGSTSDNSNSNSFNSVPSPRAYHAGAAISDSHILIFGGECQKESVNETITLKLPSKFLFDNSNSNSNNNNSDNSSNNNSNSKNSPLIVNKKWNSRLGPSAADVLPVFNHYVPAGTPAQPTRYLKVEDPAPGSEKGGLTTFDDMYVLDTFTSSWLRINSHFAPTSRMGHSLTVVESINLGPASKVGRHVVLFGGYSRDTKRASNSIYVCNVQDILNYAYSHSVANSPEKPSKKGKQQSLSPVSWRLLQCTGSAPSARYFHTATRLHLKGVDYLAIYGGVGKFDRPLCDLYLLNLETLNWECLYKVDNDRLDAGDPLAESQGIQTLAVGMADSSVSNQDEPPALHSLTSIGINSHAKASSLSSSIPSSDTKALGNNGDMNLLGNSDNLDSIIIFGGSSVVSSPAQCCSKSMYSFSIIERRWQKLQSGPNFPSHRFGHSFAFVQGYSLVYENPHTLRDTKQYYSNFAKAPLSSIAVCFGGGYQYQSATSECWILDLTYRDPRAPFDSTLNELVDDAISNEDFDMRLQLASSKRSSRLNSSSGLPPDDDPENESSELPSKYDNNRNNNYSNHTSSSKSIPIASTTYNTSILKSQSASALPANSTVNPAASTTGSIYNTGDPSLDKLILKARRERARSEIELNIERDKNKDKRDLIADLTKKIDYMIENQPVRPMTKSELEAKIAALRVAIAESIERENDLRRQNNELCDLLEAEGFN